MRRSIIPKVSACTIHFTRACMNCATTCLCSELVELDGGHTIVHPCNDLLGDLNHVDVVSIQAPAQLRDPVALKKSDTRVKLLGRETAESAHLEVILSNATRSLRPLRLNT